MRKTGCPVYPWSVSKSIKQDKKGLNTRKNLIYREPNPSWPKAPNQSQNWDTVKRCPTHHRGQRRGRIRWTQNKSDRNTNKTLRVSRNRKLLLHNNMLKHQKLTLTSFIKCRTTIIFGISAYIKLDTLYCHALWLVEGDAFKRIILFVNWVP